MCFTCGFLGCGDDFPLTGHIYEHFVQNGHAYCKPMFFILEMNDRVCIFDQSIGDFAGRLVYDSGSLNVFSKDRGKVGKGKGWGKGESALKVFEQFEEMFENKLGEQMHSLERSMHERKGDRVEVIHNYKNRISENENKILNCDKINKSFTVSIKLKKNELFDKIKDKERVILENKDLKKKILYFQNLIKIDKNKNTIKEENLKNTLKDIKFKIKQKLSEIKDAREHLKISKKLKKKNAEGGNFIFMKTEKIKKN